MQLLSQNSFICVHCNQFVSNDHMGVRNRNHCPFCLWSKHVDEKVGDRKAQCLSPMEPIGLTFKSLANGKQGELMIIHRCTSCQKISINRIASDDAVACLQALFEASLTLPKELCEKLHQEHIKIITQADRQSVHIQLFGKP